MRRIIVLRLFLVATCLEIPLPIISAKDFGVRRTTRVRFLEGRSFKTAETHCFRLLMLIATAVHSVQG